MTSLSLTIKVIEENDLDLCRDCFFNFFNESKVPGKPNFEFWKSEWKKWIELKIGVLLAYLHDNKVVGVLGTIYYNDSLTGDKEAVESFWFCLKEFRGKSIGIKLLKAFERMAKDLQVVRIKMIHLINEHQDTMRDIYTRLGYKPFEVGYIKECL